MECGQVISPKVQNQLSASQIQARVENFSVVHCSQKQTSAGKIGLNWMCQHGSPKTTANLQNQTGNQHSDAVTSGGSPQ